MVSRLLSPARRHACELFWLLRRGANLDLRLHPLNGRKLVHRKSIHMPPPQMPQTKPSNSSSNHMPHFAPSSIMKTKHSSFLSSLLSATFVLLALCCAGGAGGFFFVGAAEASDSDGGGTAGEVRVEVTKPGNGPFLVKGNTYATFLTLYYVNEKGEKTFSGFTTYVRRLWLLGRRYFIIAVFRAGMCASNRIAS